MKQYSQPSIRFGTHSLVVRTYKLGRQKPAPTNEGQEFSKGDRGCAQRKRSNQLARRGTLKRSRSSPTVATRSS